MPARPPSFKTPSGQHAYETAYREALKHLWPVPYSSRVVPTRYGGTHVIDSGPMDGPPVVLLHGQAFGATLWSGVVATLAQHARVFAVDTIGEPNLSAATRSLNGPDDYTAWLTDVLDMLNLPQVSLVGHSFGGWIAATFTRVAPKRVTHLALVAPAGTLRPLPLAFVTHALLAVLLPTSFMARRFIRWMGAPDAAPLNERYFQQVLLGLRHFRFFDSRVVPGVFTAAEWVEVRVPAVLLVGEHEAIYPAREVAREFEERGAHFEAVVVPGAGHGLPIEQPDQVAQHVQRHMRFALT